METALLVVLVVLVVVGCCGGGWVGWVGWVSTHRQFHCWWLKVHCCGMFDVFPPRSYHRRQTTQQGRQTGKDRDRPPSTGQRALVDPCGPATSGRGAGRVPGGGVFCRRGAACVSNSSSSLLPLSSVPVGRRSTPPPRCAEWWSAVATAAAMLTCSRRHHERIRRCRRLVASPESRST